MNWKDKRARDYKNIGEVRGVRPKGGVWYSDDDTADLNDGQLYGGAERGNELLIVHQMRPSSGI